MTLNFLVVINVLLPICCNTGSGMPYLRIFVEYASALLGAMTVNGVWKLVCGRNKKISNDQVNLQQKYESKIDCLLTFAKEGCYIKFWRCTVS